MSTEKSLTISILKVYNWELESSDEVYELSFSSLLTRTPIMQKSIKTHISNNQLVINTSLKITYTPEEAKVLPSYIDSAQDVQARQRWQPLGHQLVSDRPRLALGEKGSVSSL